MVWRETEASRIGLDVVDPERSSLADDQTEEAGTAGQIADTLSLGPRDPAGDESLETVAAVVEDSERRVAGLDKDPDAVDDELEHAFDRKHGRDAPDRLVECFQRLGRHGCRYESRIILAIAATRCRRNGRVRLIGRVHGSIVPPAVPAGRMTRRLARDYRPDVIYSTRPRNPIIPPCMQPSRWTPNST